MEPGNPLDLTAEDLQPLVAALTALEGSPGATVAFNKPEPDKAAVTFHEILHVWLPYLAGTGVAVELGKKVIALAGDWVKGKLDERKGRRRTVILYDHEGKPLKTITVANDGSLETKQPSSTSNRSRPPE